MLGIKNPSPTIQAAGIMILNTLHLNSIQGLFGKLILVTIRITGFYIRVNENRLVGS